MQAGSDLLFSQVATVNARAVCVGERIDVRRLGDRLADGPSMVACGGGYVAVFRYGAAVFFDVDDHDRQAFLTKVRDLVHEPFETPEHESVDIRFDSTSHEGAANDRLLLASASVERLQLVAGVLAKSVALAQYEEAMASRFARVEPLALELRQGRTPARSRALLRHIADALLIQHKMVGRAEITEKPELSWDNVELDRLYVKLAEEYELQDRHHALEAKLGVISDTAKTLLELVQARRSLRVEWYIVLLIVFEIGLTLYEMFSSH